MEAGSIFVQIAEIEKSAKILYETGVKTALLNVLSEGVSQRWLTTVQKIYKNSPVGYPTNT